jgi:DNA polymerase III epsilon subunit-like protein
MMKFYVLDTETTGVKPATDRVIELAAGLYEDGKIIGSFYFVANPGIPIPAGASAVNNWFDDDVARMPPLSEGLPKLSAFLGEHDVPVYVHNLEFDREILRCEYARANLTLPDCNWICTLEMARAIWPGHENNLTAMAERLFGETGVTMHRASNDIEVLARAVPEVLQRFAHRATRTGLAKAAPTPMAVQGTADLETQAAVVVKAASERVAKANEWALAYACDDDDDEVLGHEGIARIKTIKSEADKGRKAIVEDMDKTKRSIDKAFREAVAQPLDAAIARVEAAIKPYAMEKIRRKREAEDLAAAALREAEALASAQAAETGAVTVEAQAALFDAVAEVVEAQAPVAPVRSATSTAGYAVRRVASIVAPGQVPREYWRPDLALVQAAVDAGARQIAGVEIREEIEVKNRRRS